MKKIFALLASMFLLLGCDDGDMTFKTFNFGTVQAQRCTDRNIIYKANGTEVLILNIDPAVFVNAETGVDAPRVVTLGGEGVNSIIYRNYSSNVSTGANGTLCSEIPPASPTVKEEWIGEGTLAVETNSIVNELGVTTGFSHQIKLVSVRFRRNGEEITINDNLFGSVVTELGYTFNFGTEEEPVMIQECNGLVFKRNLEEALILAFDETVFQNVPGETTIDLANTADGNEVIFNVYDGPITNANICDAIPPISPVVENQWEALSGTVRIITTEDTLNPGMYNHVIRFDNITFQNVTTAETFDLFNVVVIENEAEGYLFGTHTTP